MHDLIHKWLIARQKWIIALYDLCCNRPFTPSPLTATATDSALNEFCVLLVDYIALGHFEILEKITARVGSQLSSIDGLLETTLAALDFNDKHQNLSHLPSLEKDLCLLTEKLALRMEWEDRIIEKAVTSIF